MRNPSEVGNVKLGRPRRGESTGTQETETGAAETGPRKVTRCLQLTLPPDLASLSDARRLMEEVGAATGLSAERTFDLKVVVSEACANAIEHANAGVEVVARLLVDRIVVEITNSGAFQPGLSVCPEGRRRGLGLPLMASLADEVHIARLPGGQTQVSLTFLVDGGVRGAGPGMDEAAELAEVVSQATSARTFKEAAESLAEWAQRLTGCDAVILRLVEPAGQAGGWIPALVHRAR
ncbi:MAG TPA: ATP-binding protein [Thermoleophilia bacterium]